MVIFVDSSVLVAVAVDSHVHHAPATAWANCWYQSAELVTSTHALAELYATVTRRGPRGFGVPHSDARSIVTTFRQRIRVVPLLLDDYIHLFERAEELGVHGPQVYDLLHAEAARKAGAEKIATINARHFRSIWPPEHLVDPTV